MYNDLEGKYNNEVMDVDQFEQHIRLKPDFYIHLTLQQLTRVFDGDVSDTEAFNKYIHLAGHLEVLCRANKIKSKDYEEKVIEIRKDAKEKFNSNTEIESYVAREKIGLLMEELFAQKESNATMSLFTNLDGSTSRQKENQERVEATKELIKEGKIKPTKGELVEDLEY